jgi:hypothetical protein
MTPRSPHLLYLRNGRFYADLRGHGGKQGGSATGSPGSAIPQNEVGSSTEGSQKEKNPMTTPDALLMTAAPETPQPPRHRPKHPKNYPGTIERRGDRGRFVTTSCRTCREAA